MPPIIDAETFEAVQRSLAARNPKKTPPRTVSSPVLLTGLAVCATCGGGMQLRTGKNGRYRYYTCSTCMRKGKSVCPGRSVPMGPFDELVIDHLLGRLFVPERMVALLEHYAEQKKAASAGGDAAIKLIDKELRDAEEGIKRLYKAIEKGVIALDETLQGRVAELRERREQLIAQKLKAEAQRTATPIPVQPEQIGKFCNMMREALRTADVQVRKAYLRLFVSEIVVGDAEVRLAGHPSALEAGARRAAVAGGVLGFVREWRPLPDSNRCYRRERAVSWASRRRGRSEALPLSTGWQAGDQGVMAGHRGGPVPPGRASVEADPAQPLGREAGGPPADAGRDQAARVQRGERLAADEEGDGGGDGAEKQQVVGGPHRHGGSPEARADLSGDIRLRRHPAP